MKPTPEKLPLRSARHGDVDDGRRGSILMETILVLPLYLMLLGGMFIVGDLLMGRLLQQDMDRALAWRAVDRFAGGFDEGAFKDAIGENGVAGGEDLPELHAFNDDGGRTSIANRWLEFSSGRADVQVDTPWWANLLDVQDIMLGDPENPDRFQRSFKLNSVDDAFLERARSYVFRRRASSNATSGVWSRSSAAQDLAWIGILFDSLAGTAISGSAPPAESVSKPYRRSPFAIAVSGEPGPWK